MSDPSATQVDRLTASRAMGSGLFRRIFLTFVLTMIASTAVATVGAYVFASRFSADWVADTTAEVEAVEPDLIAVLHDREALEGKVDALSRQLQADVSVYERPGGRIAGHGPPRLPPELRGHRRELRVGHAVIFRERPVAPPSLVLPLTADHRPTLLVVRPKRRHWWGVPLMSVSLLVAVLAAGSWVLARSLATRLHRLQGSAKRIAKGDLAHRVPVEGQKPTDEIDELARSFNFMAGKLEVLVGGQKTLLANVSHELRTPIARVKVLLEILEERAAALSEGRGNANDHADRLHKGFSEMHADVDEIESLISDLLTSGRLDLQKEGNILQRSKVDPEDLLGRVAKKFDARVDIAGIDVLDVDEMLIERLLSNLLANARRACPDGELRIEARRDLDTIRIAVEDEGSGVKPADRSAIFEPFMRLDAARDRDRGGVGLGLYLCRQIAAAHQGTLDVEDRPDGQSGARFVLELPAVG